MADEKAVEMAALIAANLYDTQILPDLEDYVNFQAKTGTYDFDANRHLLKLYLFAPDTIKIEVVHKLLVKALMNLPETDFLSCICMLPLKLHEVEPVRSLIGLADLLETAQFKTFWNKARDNEQVHRVKGFESAIREFVAITVRSTYQMVPAPLFKELLNIGTKKDFDAYVKEKGWTKTEDNYVQFPLSKDNSISEQEEDRGTPSAQQFAKIHPALLNPPSVFEPPEQPLLNPL